METELKEASVYRDVVFENVKKQIEIASKNGETSIHYRPYLSFQMEQYLREKGFYVSGNVCSAYTYISWLDMLTINNINKLEGAIAIVGKYRIVVENTTNSMSTYTIRFKEDTRVGNIWCFNGNHGVMIDRYDFNAIADAYVLTYKNTRYYLNIESLNNAANTMHQFAKIIFDNQHIDDIIIPLNNKV